MKPEPMEDLRLLLAGAGLDNVEIRRGAFEVVGRSPSCTIHCVDERRSAPWEAKGVQLLFEPIHASMWKLNIREVQKFLGLTVDGDLICPVERAKLQLALVLAPLESKLASLRERPQELETLIRRARFG